MFRALRISALITALLALASCTKRESTKGYAVSVAPQAWLMEQLVGDATPVTVVLPSGNDPEGFDPTPATLKALSDADAYFMLGTFEFEKALAPNSPRAVDLSASMTLRPDSAHHGIDPHIWLSPRLMRSMAEQMAATLTELQPDSADVYSRRLALLTARIDSIDARLKGLSPQDGEVKAFLTLHPSLGYFADAYGLRQIALEGADGKEHTLRSMASSLDDLAASGAKVMIVEKGMKGKAQSLPLKDIEIVEVDLMAPRWDATMATLHKALK